MSHSTQNFSSALVRKYCTLSFTKIEICFLLYLVKPPHGVWKWNRNLEAEMALQKCVLYYMHMVNFQPKINIKLSKNRRHEVGANICQMDVPFLNFFSLRRLKNNWKQIPTLAREVHSCRPWPLDHLSHSTTKLRFFSLFADFDRSLQNFTVWVCVSSLVGALSPHKMAFTGQDIDKHTEGRSNIKQSFSSTSSPPNDSSLYLLELSAGGLGLDV